MYQKILVVDDDFALTNTLERVLKGSGYVPVTAHTAEDGLRFAISQQPDLALLDVMVPSMGGWELCQRLRALSDMPIIFLTALGNVENVVRGLETGADDYMVKPFSHSEILARINAQLRRMRPAGTPSQRFSFGKGTLTIDLAARLVQTAGQSVDLTPREFELLSALVCSAGRVIPTADLVRQAWGLDDSDALDNIKPYIHYLRKKIEVDPASPRWIVTVRGVGYRFAGE